MKIGVIYFSQEIDNARKHHSVSNKLLSIWLKFYHKSKTTLEPILITDQKTVIPKFWNYDYIRIIDCESEKSNDILHKVGWIKHQVFDYIGKCLLLDLDAFIISNLDHVKEIECPFAMAVDFNTFSKNWWFYETYPDSKYKHNAGVMILNSAEISSKFKNKWEEKFDEFKSITFLDEVIFSDIKNELNGYSLDVNYNFVWEQNIPNDCKIIHFSGANKSKIKEFLHENIFI